MPAPRTTDEFLEVVRKSGLADPDGLITAMEEFRESGLALEPKKLAGFLVKKGILTNFYAEQLIRGIYRGFKIGKYQIIERIGSGGMGIVYLGEHKYMGNRVAIKVLPLTLAEHPWFLKRFYREAQAIAALDHPNIVRAFDMDQEGKLHFLVMEFVDGASLQDIVGKYGPMTVDRAAHYTRQAARGLQHLHEIGLVHRDIKPGNLLLDRHGVIKILDLGLARFFRENGREAFSNKSNERTMVGTDDYLAPEQIVNSDDVDIRADIYSLGATFYFLLTGKSPFEDEELAYQKLIKHLSQQPKALRDLKPDVPAALAGLVEKMMAKNPWQRFQTPAQVVEALAVWTQKDIAEPPASEMPRLWPALQRSWAGGPASSAVVSASGNSSVVRANGQLPSSSHASGFFSDRLKCGASLPPTPPPSKVPVVSDTVKEEPGHPLEQPPASSGQDDSII